MSIFTNSAASAPQSAESYVNAILGLVGDQEPFGVLESQIATIKEQIKDLSESELAQPEAEGKWSIAEVIQHLTDSELVWAYRLRLVVAQDRPELTGYDQDLWAQKLRYRETIVTEALEQWQIMRRANLKLLHSFSGDELKRVGVHKERGEESVEYMIKLYAGHDLVHRNQILRILEKQKT